MTIFPIVVQTRYNQWQHGDRFSTALRLQIGTCAKRYAFTGVQRDKGYFQSIHGYFLYIHNGRGNSFCFLDDDPKKKKYGKNEIEH